MALSEKKAIIAFIGKFAQHFQLKGSENATEKFTKNTIIIIIINYAMAIVQKKTTILQ